MSDVNTVEEPAAAPAPEFAARIGLDWADQKHFWTMLDEGGKKTRGQLEDVYKRQVRHPVHEHCRVLQRCSSSFGKWTTNGSF